MSDKSVFQTLSETNARSSYQQKGKFCYLSWSNAVRVMSKAYPKSSWEFTKFEGLPFLKTDLGYFVECSVTIENVTRTQMLPVLDHKNQPMMTPKSANINNSMMRCLTKTIAIHGLALELWAGEDLVGFESDTASDPKPRDDWADAIAKLLSDKSESDYLPWLSEKLGREITMLTQIEASESINIIRVLENAKS